MLRSSAFYIKGFFKNSSTSSKARETKASFTKWDELPTDLQAPVVEFLGTPDLVAIGATNKKHYTLSQKQLMTPQHFQYFFNQEVDIKTLDSRLRYVRKLLDSSKFSSKDRQLNEKKRELLIRGIQHFFSGPSLQQLTLSIWILGHGEEKALEWIVAHYRLIPEPLFDKRENNALSFISIISVSLAEIHKKQLEQMREATLEQLSKKSNAEIDKIYRLFPPSAPFKNAASFSTREKKSITRLRN